MYWHVPTELIQSVEVFSANLTFVFTADIVCAAMFGQVGRLAKSLSANLTFEWLFSSVGTEMHCW